MIFVLDTAIGIGILLPFTIGKSTAMLSVSSAFLCSLCLAQFVTAESPPTIANAALTHPRHAHYYRSNCGYCPIPLARIPPTPNLSIGSGHLQSVVPWYSVFHREDFRQAKGRRNSPVQCYNRKFSPIEFSNAHTLQQLLHAHELQQKPLGRIFNWTKGTTEVQGPVNNTTTLSYIESTFPGLVKAAEPYFAVLGKEVRLSAARLGTKWTEMALGSSPMDRVFAILLGYAVVGLLLALYLNVLTVGNAKSAGRAVRSAVRQQLLVLKVCGRRFYPVLAN